MTEKELKHLNRRELLEMLIYQSKKNALLQNKVDELNKRLQSRETMLSETGNIAEAVIKMNGLFETAQKTADDFTEQSKRLIDEAEYRHDEIIFDAEEEAETIKKKTSEYCRRMLELTVEKMEEKIGEVKKGLSESGKTDGNTDGQTADEQHTGETAENGSGLSEPDSGLTEGSTDDFRKET